MKILTYIKSLFSRLFKREDPTLHELLTALFREDKKVIFHKHNPDAPVTEVTVVDGCVEIYTDPLLTKVRAYEYPDGTFFHSDSCSFEVLIDYIIAVGVHPRWLHMVDTGLYAGEFRSIFPHYIQGKPSSTELVTKLRIRNVSVVSK